MARRRALASLLAVVLAGCPADPPAPLPPYTPNTPTPPPSSQPDPAPKPTDPAPQPTDPAPKPTDPAPQPDPVDPTPGPSEASVTNLYTILEELTEIEDMGIDFDDREGDHARRFERPQALLREALALKIGVEEALVELIEMRQVEEGMGHQRRPFLARLLAHQTDPRALDEVGAGLRRLNPDEVAQVLEAMPEGEVAAGALGRWYIGMARFAKSTGQDTTEELRLAVLEAWGARKPASGDAALVAAAKDDPSERVRTRARQIVR